jgi:DNA polymerase III alpha subunit
MTQNGVTPKAQDDIVQFISSFALYGFPESHSASFALIAYASAFLKVRYLAAFTAALLNTGQWVLLTSHDHKRRREARAQSKTN